MRFGGMGGDVCHVNPDLAALLVDKRIAGVESSVADRAGELRKKVVILATTKKLLSFAPTALDRRRRFSDAMCGRLLMVFECGSKCRRL